MEIIKIGVMANKDIITGLKIGGLVEEENYFIPIDNLEQGELVEKFDKITSRENIEILFICESAMKKIETRVKSFDKSVPNIFVIPKISEN